MIQTVARGGGITLDAQFLNSFGQLEDADPVRVDIIDPNDVEAVSNASPTTHTGTGLYSYTYTVPDDAPLGLWGIRWAGVMDEAPLDEQVEYFEVIAASSVIPEGETYATLEEFIERKGPVPDDETDRVSALLVDASALIAAEAVGSEQDWVSWESAAPAVIRAICIEVAYRAWSNPDAITQYTNADASMSYGSGAKEALFLTTAEKRAIRQQSRTSSFRSIEIVSPYSGDEETSLLDFWPDGM